jgi:hypothetical protein
MSAGALLPALSAGGTAARPLARPRSYRVETWGCQMNVLDGERMAGQLESLGLESRGGDSASARRPDLQHLRRPGEGGGEGLQRPGGRGREEARQPGPRRRGDGMPGPGLRRRDPGARALGGLRAGDRQRRDSRRDRPPGLGRTAADEIARPARGLSRLPVPPDLPRLPFPGLRTVIEGAISTAPSASSRSPGGGALRRSPRCSKRSAGSWAGATEVALLGQRSTPTAIPTTASGWAADEPRRSRLARLRF